MEIPTPAMWTCVADIAIVVWRDVILLLDLASFWEAHAAKADRHGKRQPWFHRPPRYLLILLTRTEIAFLDVLHLLGVRAYNGTLSNSPPCHLVPGSNPSYSRFVADHIWIRSMFITAFQLKSLNRRERYLPRLAVPATILCMMMVLGDT
jgi:hypothetical protein